MRYSPKTISDAYFLRLNSDEKSLTRELVAMDEAFEAIKQSSVLKQLNNPTLSKESRRKLMEQMFPVFSFAPATKELFVILAQDRTIKLLPKILTELKKLREKKFGVTEVVLTTAVSISASLQKTIQTFLEKNLTNGKSALLSKRTDENLLGGFVAQNGSLLLDASTKRKINLIQKTISS